MFHRVKSEVQETEQRVQQRQKVDLDYRQESERPSSVRDSVQTTQAESIRDDLKPRSYIKSETVEQEEENTMSSRTIEDKEVQGKYPREQQEVPAMRQRSLEVPAPSASPYQRPTQTAPSAAVSRPSSYTAPTYTPPQASPVAETSAYASSSSSARTLTIGRGINMSGEIEACDHLVVEGTVEASLKGAKVLDIEESGTFYGAVEIEEATIAGRFEGDITVNGRLTIRASGTITGSIAYRELEVEAGAMIDGRMTPIKGNVDPKSLEKYRAGTEASAMAKAKEAKKDSREPANSESALFSKSHTAY